MVFYLVWLVFCVCVVVVVMVLLLQMNRRSSSDCEGMCVLLMGIQSL